MLSLGVLSKSTPMAITPGHLLGQMGFRDVLETDERLIVEMDNRPDLTNIRAALQGGLVATLIDIAAGRLAGRHVRADQDVTTADMDVHFLAPVVEGPARPEATLCAQAGDRSSRPSTSQTSAARHARRSASPCSTSAKFGA